MELWSIYESIGTITGMFGKVQPDDPNYGDTLLITAIVSASIGLIVFLLQGLALYCMAKKRKLRYKGLAFVPFANILLMGRLAGDTTFFGQRIKRAGLYAMIAQIIVTVLVCSYILSDIYLHQSGCIRYEAVDDALEQFRVHWNEGTRFQKFLFNYTYDVVYLLHMILGLASEILMLMLLSSLYKKYAPDSYVWMTVLTLFVPLASCVILLVLRNRKAVDYQAYMRAKHEAYMRRNQQYYGQGGYNPYGGSPYGGYQQGYGQQSAPQNKPEEPFSEFASDKKQDEPFSEFSSDGKNKNDGDSDGFFD
ncbi:MAG: hypothetical protein IJ284_03565 [Clostridia bacterium]|nr:hypothetical protein [Clostridia bacterium]MBQ7948820.1 hypothetical protein [Clostridia bacterium]